MGHCKRSIWMGLLVAVVVSDQDSGEELVRQLYQIDRAKGLVNQFVPSPEGGGSAAQILEHLHHAVAVGLECLPSFAGQAQERARDLFHEFLLDFDVAGGLQLAQVRG